jgi:hypothetical protein
MKLFLGVIILQTFSHRMMLRGKKFRVSVLDNPLYPKFVTKACWNLLSSASHWGGLLALPANIRLGCEGQTF